MSEKNDQNALWQKLNSHNPKFRVVAVLEQPQRVLTGEYLPRSEFRVVAVEECHAQNTKTLN
jgi:type II secretory pathway predicted ATPase ExeA